MMKKVDNANNSKKIYLLTILVIFLTSVLAISFAYGTTVVVGSFKKTNISSLDSVGVVTLSSKNISLQVSRDDMLEEMGSSNYDQYVDSSNPGYIKINVQTGEHSEKVECTYGLVLKVKKGYVKSIDNVNNLKELTLLTKVNLVKGSSSIVTYTGTNKEIDLTGKVGNIELYKNLKIYIYGAKKEAEIRWDLVPRYYNLDFSQSDASGKSYEYEITTNNLECKLVK